MENKNKLEFTLCFFWTHTKILIASVLVVSIIWLIIAFNYPFVFLSENQYLYLFSTQAQVLGAVYGLSLTGYVFLRNNQDRLIEQDESLYEVITKIQIKDYSLLLLITCMSVVTIFIDILSLMTFDLSYYFAKIFIKNLASVFFVITIVLISYFILMALRSGQIAKVSKEMVDDLGVKEDYNITPKTNNVEYESGVNSSGDNDFYLYGKFMRLFLDLEAELYSLYSKYYSGVAYRKPNVTPLSLVVNDLGRMGVIKQPLETNLRRIIQYRNALVHSRNESTNEAMLDVLLNIKDQVSKINA
ncbi:TPA: hypothetical protein ACHS94_001768 [Citrobacter freundii]|uniref:hypothetical protein n=1 Tax=Citrobacter freundii TaxID=546 RepID=UPI002993DDDA|nr:hypothetical protein [Citrobacter freundii]HBM8408784.1 hypothetical protein [Citrobacter freundii]HBM9445675.1 hypothetical protein [Citrobacter freundii]HCC4671368.1 hypothetical protein [Citrobacter freundii]HCC4804637.1 hypothetical protein [Citrobacter freundii]